MEQLEVIVPSKSRFANTYPDYSESWWGIGSFDSELTAYPVSGDDIARWRAEKG